MLVCLLVSFESIARMGQEARTLEMSKAVERELSGGQVHRYELLLTAGQYVHIVVDQRGIDVVVTLFGPDGRKLAEIDSPNGLQGPEPLSAITEVSGTYGLEVRSLEKEAGGGRYQASIKELRTAVSQDSNRVAADKAFAEGEQLRTQGTAASLRKSIEKYEEAVRLRRIVGDKAEEAGMLGNIGSIYYMLGEMQKALQSFNQALPIWQALSNRAEEAAIKSDIGSVYLSQGEPQKALDYLNQSLQLARAAGDPVGESTTLTNIGAAYSMMGEKQQALKYYSQALPLLRAAGNRSLEATTLNNIGAVYWSLGELQEALNYYSQALPALKVSGDRRREARTLGNIGEVQTMLGEPQKALDSFNQAREIMKAVGDRDGEATAVNNIGGVHDSLGDPQKALDFYEQSLQLLRALGDRRREALTLKNMGASLLDLRQPQKAAEYLSQAIVLIRAAGDRLGEAYVLHNLGGVHDLLGEQQEASDYFRKALDITRAVGDRGSEARMLYNLARFEYKRDNLLEARSLIEAALVIIESQRGKIVSQQQRVSFLASRQNFYELYIDLLMRLNRDHGGEGYEGLALQASERARARGLLEILNEARADIRQGVDSQLLERERQLQQQLNAKEQARMRLLSGKHTEEQAAVADKEIGKLSSEFQEVQAQIRAKSPRYAALTQPQPLGLREIQREVVDGDTLLLEYALGEERSYLWAVSADAVGSYELPGRGEVEGAARRFYDLVTARGRASRTTGRTSGGGEGKGVPGKEELGDAASALSWMLLGPVGPQLGNKRLLIIAQGVLQYVPFGALPEPVGTRPGSSEAGVPLIVGHEIVCLPSASTLAVLRREVSGRRAGSKAVAVIADPVFSADDVRVKRARGEAEGRREEASGVQAQTGVQGLERAVREAGLGGGELRIPRLPGTRREAAGIVALVAEGERKEALDFEASRGTVTGGDLSGYRIVHFATHGLLNSEHPELSGILLSLVDRGGKEQDGYLRLHEIYNLKLPAELVVLSACQTGLGKEIKGEGLVGLTRGFMYAGSPRVVASLWKVDDKATAELMKRFYGGMLRGTGERAAAALRTAQVSMWKTKGWEDPYYWAAFVLQGEWR